VIDTVYPRAAMFLREQPQLGPGRDAEPLLRWLRMESRRTGERFLPQRASFLL
jgi:hypothetical protein